MALTATYKSSSMQDHDTWVRYFPCSRLEKETA